jgi:hypothetical protein
MRLFSRKTPSLFALILVAVGAVWGVACDDDDLFVIKEPDNQTDVFQQKAAAKVDILWVIDNSESMAAEQAKVAQGFLEFFSQLLTSEVDYHIGVITTDPDDLGVLRAYNGSSTTDLQSTCPAKLVFQNLIDAGIAGSPFEEGFRQAAMAVGADQIDPITGAPPQPPNIPASNSGFLRDDASLYLIFVSDEDEGAKSDGVDIVYYKRLFESLKGAGNENMVSVSAITGWPNESSLPSLDAVCDVLGTSFDTDPGNDDPRVGQVKEALASSGGCIDQGAGAQDDNSFAETGSRYIELACRTRGVVTNMCDSEYSTALDALGANAAGLLRKFILSKANDINFGPDCEPFTEDDPTIDCDDNGSTGDEIDSVICVKAVNIEDRDADATLVPRQYWEWENSVGAVRFPGGFLPAPGSQVEITYKLTPSNATFKCGEGE